MIYRFECTRPGRQNLTFRYVANPQASGSVEADGTTGIVYNGRLDSNGMQFLIRARAVAESGTVTVEMARLR